MSELPICDELMRVLPHPVSQQAADIISALYKALVEARLSVGASVEETSDPDAKYHDFNHVFVERLAKIDAALSLAQTKKASQP